MAVAGRRCRVLYQKYLEWAPSSCSAWSRYAELESSLGEAQRARGIYELAIAQPLLDMPEVRTVLAEACYCCSPAGHAQHVQ